jgi:hypothetical protein
VNRLVASALFALLAGMIAYDAGVPLWSDWIPGDVADIAITAFYAVFTLIGAMRATVIVNVSDSGK